MGALLDVSGKFRGRNQAVGHPVGRAFQPDSAIPPRGITAWPSHRPRANPRAVLVGLRRSFARREVASRESASTTTASTARAAPPPRRSGFPLTSCMNALEPHLDSTAPETLAPRPFSPSSRLAGLVGEYKRLGETPRGGAGGVRRRESAPARNLHSVSFQPDSQPLVPSPAGPAAPGYGDGTTANGCGRDARGPRARRRLRRQRRTPTAMTHHCKHTRGVGYV